MRNFYGSLPEKDRRRYAAVEAAKSGYGGITYICRVLRCDTDRVRRGIEELNHPLPEQEKRLRKPGGGRKSVLSAAVGLEDAFFKVLRNHTYCSATAAGATTPVIIFSKKIRRSCRTNLISQSVSRIIRRTRQTSVLDQVFRTERNAAEGFKENMKIQFDGFLPKWNYVAVPSRRNQFPWLFNSRS